MGPPTEVGTAVFVEKMNDEGRMVVSLAEVDCAWAQLMGGKDDPNTDTATMLANAEKRFGVSMKGATPRNPPLLRPDNDAVRGRVWAVPLRDCADTPTADGALHVGRPTPRDPDLFAWEH